MPDGRKLAIIFTLITLFVCSMPFIVAWPEGLSGLAVTGGALFVLNHYTIVLSAIVIGLVSAFLTRDGVVLVPVCYILMFSLANMLMLGVDAYPNFYLYIFGTILLFGVSLMLAGHRAHLVLALVIASIAFHLGVYFSPGVALHEQPLYFLIGELIATALLLCISVSFGMIISDVVLQWLLPEPASETEYDA